MVAIKYVNIKRLVISLLTGRVKRERAREGEKYLGREGLGKEGRGWIEYHYR